MFPKVISPFRPAGKSDNPFCPSLSPACALRSRGDGERPANAGRPRAPSGRILDEAFATGDPLKLMRLFGITDATAMRYVGAAYPGRTAKLPR
ncbi:hypothetical protein HS99_0018525 [Kitasatospora aureofaciens]|uniref:Uncharacterized protein n=1 Tax=Kitasatospora aureofaciens TaxID=1894 RepID=A0A1E7NF22_KITAU|nr:hypothetical protein B6264_30805 [Kitasatospora aureofaciens]OEV39083.1 hypothetical protein HS99_0018525 [Kitasatospora aureofaciens]GGV04548.1 hypothetical protein GCM10010502_69120 [Kitasatospora aureofaciens]